MIDEAFWREQRTNRYASHIAPINELVDELGSDSGGGTSPCVAPWYIGVEAQIVAILRDPGPGADGEAGSGFLCTHNDDETSRRQQRFMEDAGIDPRTVIPWNAYPWYINRAPTAVELDAGTDPLWRLIERLPRLAVVLLHGNEAHRAWKLLLRAHGAELATRSIRWVETYHPSRGALQLQIRMNGPPGNSILKMPTRSLRW